MPAIGPDLAGHSLAPISYAWTERDTILYALGIGARLPADLDYVYEARGPVVPATFALAAVALALPALVDALEIEVTTLLHASQAIELHRVPAAAGSGTVTRRVTGVWDKGRAALIDCEDGVADERGTLATAHSTWWVAGAGGFGGPRADPHAAPAAAARATPQDRAPDLRARVQTTAEQAALHRLSGDRNPVHIDPDVAVAAGQPRPFLHGLCTLGALGHALDRAAAPDGRRLRSLSGRFTRPVFPGDALELSAWWDDGATGLARVDVGGEPVLGPVEATFVPRA